MTLPNLFWKLTVASLAVTGAGAILDSVFPSPGPGWMEDMFDVFGDDDDEL